MLTCRPLKGAGKHLAYLVTWSTCLVVHDYITNSGARYHALRASVLLLCVAIAFVGTQTSGSAEPQDDQSLRFRSGIELINVTATVTDRRGRFVSGLEKEDFLVYEDGELQTISHFSNERVPVSLGIVLDTSGSMEGTKMVAAMDALDRFLYELLGPEDEIFIYAFNYEPELVHRRTTNRDSLSRALRRVRPRGGTALYDAVAEAVPMAQDGSHRKKAVVIISDGNDTNSMTDVRDLQRLIQESEVLVYAIGIDGLGRSRGIAGRPVPRNPIPFPFPGTGRGRGRPPIPTPTPWPGSGRGAVGDDRVNVSALRDLTDDSGGRTEIVRNPEDLDPATAGVADELSRQYYLAYPAAGHDDGQWHAIDVEVPDTRYRVRARRGYLATP